MKKLSFFLMAMLFTCATTLQAAEVTETIAMKGFGGLTTSSYENVTQTGTSDLGTEMVAYAFNPSTGQIRGNKTTIAGASITSADKNKNWSLYNTQAMPGAIKTITVTQTATGANKFKGKLFVALGTTNQGDVTTVTGAQENTTGTATEFTFNIDETQGYTYFKLLSNVAFTSGSVAGAVVTVTYVTAEGGEEEVTKYTVTTNVNDPAMGTVSGAGEYAEGKTATLTANANPGYKFVNWSNGSTDNPLKITVTEDVEVTANFEAVPPMTCAEAAATAAGTTVVLNPFDVVAVVKDAGYIYIEDESGVNLIYDYNLAKELKAGDHVEGFVGNSSPYNGLPELKTSVAYTDLTVTHGTAPEPTLFTEAPVKADVNKYVKFENVTFTADVTYTAGSTGSNATMVVNGTNVTVRNTFKLAATLSKDKAYNLVGFVAVYNSTIQVYFLSIEEYVAPVVNHTITVSANPAEAGTVTGGGEYEEGTEVALTATAAEGYEFVKWTSGETEVSTENPYTFTVTADVALVANFVAVDYKDITFTVGKSGFTGVPQIKWWGAKGLEDAAEPVEMTAGQYSRYSYTFSNIDAITGVSFYIVLDGVQSKTITLHETPNTYSQFYTILQEVFVTLDGEIEGVQLEGHPMAGYSSDYTKVNGVVQLPANTTKVFKLTVDGKDKGGNTIALTKDNLTANFTEDGEGNATIATELAGGYLFTYDYITKDVTVVYPFVGTMDLGQMTPSYSDESVTLKDDNYNEVTIYNVVEGEHTYGENFDIEASVKHNGEWYTLRGKGSWTLVDGVMTLVTTNLVDENKTVNYTITATALAPQEYTIACNGTYDEEVTEYYSSIKYAATTDEEDVIVIEIGVYGEETSASGQFNDNWFTTLTYTVAEGEDGVKVLTATATDEAGNTYHITITATKLVYPSINIYNATLVEEEEGDVRLTCTYESVNFTLNYSYAMWAGGYTAELASEDYTVFYSCEAPSLEKDGSNYTITGVFSDENSNKYNVMVTTKANPTTSLDNLNSIVAPVKMIENGQLIIVKDGVQYNAQGAVVK